MDVFQESLKYHAAEPAGKFSVEPTKPMNSQKDLSLAYSPGVAQPCLEINKGNGQKNLISLSGHRARAWAHKYDPALRSSERKHYLIFRKFERKTRLFTFGSFMTSSEIRQKPMNTRTKETSLLLFQMEPLFSVWETSALWPRSRSWRARPFFSKSLRR